VESLESRRLLSAAAFQPLVASGLPVSAIVGSAEATSITPIVPSGSSGNMASQSQFGFGLNPVVPNAPAGSGVLEVLIIEVSFSNGIGAPSGLVASNPSNRFGAPSGPVASNPSSGPETGGTTASSTAITPLTPTILAGSAPQNRAPVVVIVAPQPLVANLGPSTISVTTQAILLTALLEEQPIPRRCWVKASSHRPDRATTSSPVLFSGVK